MIKITTTSVFVGDQEQALQFYTQTLGFSKRSDIPVGDARWLTVGTPGGPDDVELLLEPANNSIASTYQEAIFQAGIPATTFGVDDIRGEVERLKGLGVAFRLEPTEMGQATIAIFDDTCGNLIQIAQV